MDTIGVDSVIEKITFNIEFSGKKYNDVCIEYDKKDRLTLGDIHYEDNDSWHLVEIGGITYDFQIYGDDDSKASKSTEGILNTRLSVQLYEMYLDKGELCHSSNIISTIDGTAKITNMRIYTNHGIKSVKVG